MEWYRYNPDTLEYEHPVICQPNPARPGEFLIPPSATELELPSTGNHEVAVFQPDSKSWIIKPDYRGTEYWLPDGSHHKIEQIGEVPPENALDQQQPPPPPTPEEEYREMILQRDKMLDDTDWIIMRQKDQRDLGMGETTLSYEGWFLNLYWTETIKNRERTEQELTDLQKSLYELKHDISTLYLTKDDFQEYQKEQGERYRHLDNKLRNR